MKGKDIKTLLWYNLRMNLPSYSFIFIFLPIVLIGWFFLNSKGLVRVAKCLLLIASLYFYASMGGKAIIAIILSVIVCYLIGTYAFKPSVPITLQKILLAFGIILNIAALIYCKYLTYFEMLLNEHAGTSLAFTAIVLPTGISYYTFSQIAYLVDSYKHSDTKYNFLDYSLFVTFFPKVTVGPIALSTEMIPQFNDPSRKKVNYENFSKGLYGFIFGMAKKLLIADSLAPFVDLGYKNIANLGTTNSLMVIISYTMQIYFDFSGYCDMAIGICRMLNFDLPDNFDAPYRSLSIAEFWKRWHITLTRFFRNYVYIPLGGNRKGKVRTYLNNFLIFFLSGLWHGAATTYVVWGIIHGIGSIISKIASPVTQKLPKALRWFVTFAFVNLAWVYFRAPDIASANLMIKELFTGGIIPINIDMVATTIPVEGDFIQWVVLKLAPTMTYYTGSAILITLMIFAVCASTLMKTTAERVRDFTPTKGRIAIAVILFTLSVLSLSEVSQFIYVNF